MQTAPSGAGNLAQPPPGYSRAASAPKDKQNDQLCMPLAMRAPECGMMELTDDALFDISVQFTEERGFREPVRNLWQARQQSQEHEDQEDNEDDMEEARIRAEEEMAQQRDPPDVATYITNEINRLHAKDGSNIEYVRRPHPELDEYDKFVKKKLKEDGISNIFHAMSCCPICDADIDPKDFKAVSNARNEFTFLYMDRQTSTNDVSTYEELKRHWNTVLVPACPKNLKTGWTMPKISWGQVYIHFEHCNVSNTIPTLKRQLRIINAAVDTFVHNNLIVEQVNSGTTSGNLALAKDASRHLLNLLAEQRRISQEILQVSLQWSSIRGSPYVLTPYFPKRQRVTPSQLDRLAKQYSTDSTQGGGMSNVGVGRSKLQSVNRVQAGNATFSRSMPA